VSLVRSDTCRSDTCPCPVCPGIAMLPPHCLAARPLPPTLPLLPTGPNRQNTGKTWLLTPSPKPGRMGPQ
jgi:hypothetical protein